MTTLTSHTINKIRYAFIDTLSDESTLATDHGIYAHISPLNIEQLFNDFANQNLTARDFSRQFLRTII